MDKATVSRETKTLPPLEVRGLSARLGGRRVLHDIDFVVAPGTFTALVGPNGSGKSTLLRCLSGGLRPESGEARVRGVDVRSIAANSLSQLLAFVPQHNPITFAFTVEELVRLGGIGEAVERALQATDLIHLRSRSVLNLSGGERQRAALARALAQETPLLLLDEPVTHLDPRHQYGVLRSAKQATQNGTRSVLAVLHDLSLAAAFADRLLLMHDGRLLADASPEEALHPEKLQQAYGIPFVLREQPPEDGPTIVIRGREHGENITDSPQT